MRLLLILILSLGLGLGIVAAERVRRPFARIVRGLMYSFALTLAILGTVLAVAGIANESWSLAIIGTAVLAMASLVGWRNRPYRLATGSAQHVPLTSEIAEPHWRKFEPHLDWVSRQQARKARAAIDRFLAERESPSLSSAHRTLLISCEKRVPELIDVCLERCRNAGADERSRYIDSTLDTLVQIGTEAERARREVREADDRRLQVFHHYFDGVAGPRDGQEERP